MPRPPKNPQNQNTAARILDIAERMIQERGYNAFSYADIAIELGVTKASLHYHFRSKAALGLRILGRYQQRFFDAIQAITSNSPNSKKLLQRYMGIYASVLRSGRMCLCGVLAAEYDSLPELMQEAVRKFIDNNDRWLATVLDNARRKKEVYFSGLPLAQARFLTASLEGAMLLARPYAEEQRFDATARTLLKDLAMKPKDVR